MYNEELDNESLIKNRYKKNNQDYSHNLGKFKTENIIFINYKNKISNRYYKRRFSF